MLPSDDPVAGPASPRPLPVQRELFDIPDDVAYFNCASLAPLLKAAVEAGAAASSRRARPWLIGEDDWFTEAEERRALFSRLAGLDPEGVALVPTTSYGLAVAAANLDARPGQRVLVMADDYPSNRYTWQRFARRTGTELVVVERRDGRSWGEAVLQALDERTAVVTVLATHWTDGGAVDLTAIGARAREDGAALVDYQDRYQPGARRFDVGGRTHFETTPMAVAGLRQLLDWEVPRVAATLGLLTDRIQRRVEAIGVRLTSSDRVPHMLGIALPDQARAAAARALAQAGVFVGIRGASLRVSPHLWTTDQDVDRLVGALEEATRRTEVS